MSILSQQSVALSPLEYRLDLIMSGFEIAGIALAILPLAVEAFKVYKTYFPSSKKFQEDLKQLVQDLTSERLRLYNTCDRLLGPLLDQTTTAKGLLEDPRSPKWKKIGPQFDAQLRTLLDGTYTKFQEQLDEINKSFEELRLKLKLPDPRY
ncbi:hypothetical protein QBC45DRAFT_417342 [Copromyces sp. CBS 386.78]|nr:hypothetical protein QBC45DRAFT_417342 [Copromyces sp. CBS 386.78]